MSLQTFSLNLAYPGRKGQVKQQIVEMTLNGSGVRDISAGWGEFRHGDSRVKKLNSNQ